MTIFITTRRQIDSKLHSSPPTLKVKYTPQNTSLHSWSPASCLAPSLCVSSWPHCPTTRGAHSSLSASLLTSDVGLSKGSVRAPLPVSLLSPRASSWWRAPRCISPCFPSALRWHDCWTSPGGVSEGEAPIALTRGCSEKTNLPQFSGLKQRKCIRSQFWRPEV